MAGDLVTFNIRYERSKFVLKIESPTDVFGFIEKLKSELNVEEDTDELVVLCPTPEGKMMEIKSDDDIAFLKKTKLSYNSESKEIYCSVELVVTIIHKKLPDDPKFEIMLLSKKVDQLTSQLSEMSRSFDNKIEENTNFLLTNIKSILQTDFGNKAETNILGEQNGNSNGLGSSESKLKQKKVKKNKEKLQTSYNTTSTTNDNSPKLNETLHQDKSPVFSKNDPKDIDTLLDMLVKEGFVNTIQNIIVLKRFDNNYEKAIEYLKQSM